MRLCLQQLTDTKCLSSPRELAAIGFKAVHAKGLTGVHRVDEKVLAAMEAYNDVAPAHNPPYVTAMRLLARELPEIPLVAAFESGFHETIPAGPAPYAVPLEWARSSASSAGDSTARAIATSPSEPRLLIEQAGREDHLVSPGRQQFAVRDSRRKIGCEPLGHESAIWSAAQQSRR